jgi:hypothetical protein
MPGEMSDRELLQTTHDAVIELSAVVLGVHGQGGLMQDMGEVRLSVSNMTLKTANSEQNVVDLLNKVATMYEELHEKGGVCDTLAAHTDQLSVNNNLIKALWAVCSSVIIGFIAYVITHWKVT